jgi:anti-sigma factor RsiW
MNDCTNAEMRDQLPDLLHERLDASTRAAVMAHVGDCVDCRDELQLLRDVSAVMTRGTPRVDVSYVVGALPLPPRRTAAPAAKRRAVWTDWRVAAAVTLMVAGGTSLALLNLNSTPDASVRVGDTSRITTTAVTPVPAASSNDTPVVSVPATNRTVAATAETPVPAEANDSRFSDLDEQQLKALLGDIEKLQAVPVTEPEPVMIRVSGTSSTEGEDS